MTDYTQAGAELAAKLSNAECDTDAWTARDFSTSDAPATSVLTHRAFGKFCAQVLEERAAPPGVRTPASDQAAVDLANACYPRSSYITMDCSSGWLRILSEQIATERALGMENSKLVGEAALMSMQIQGSIDIIALCDERIAELEAGVAQALEQLDAISTAPGSQDALREATDILTHLMPANVDPLVAALTEMLVRRGIAPDPDVMRDEAAFVRARLSEAELGKAQP